MTKKLIKPIQKKKSIKLRTITGVFGVVGMLVVSLGLLSISQTALNTNTNLESQAYSGWTNPQKVKPKVINVTSKTGGGAKPPPNTSAGTGQPPANSNSGKVTGDSAASAVSNAQNGSGHINDGGDAANAVSNAQNGGGQNGGHTNDGGAAANAVSNAQNSGGHTNDGGAATTAVSNAQNSSSKPATTNTTSQTTTTTSSNSNSNNSGSSSGGSGSSSSNNNSNKRYRDADSESTTANAMKCAQPMLTQFYIRGGQAWVRGVAIDATTGKEQWNNPGQTFRMVIDLNKDPGILPGNNRARIQAYDAHVNPLTGRFVQYVLRDNTIFVKTIPSEKGRINWVTEAQAGWQQLNFGQTTNVPTAGDINAYEVLMTVTGSDADKKVNYIEYFTRGNKSYVNKGGWDRFVNGQLTEQSDGGFEFLLDNPTMQAQADYVDYTGTVLHQSWFANNIGYVRDVPIENGAPNFSKAPAPTMVMDLNANKTALPGTGEMEAFANYISCWSI